jgi:hypothetical protein
MVRLKMPHTAEALEPVEGLEAVPPVVTSCEAPQLSIVAMKVSRLKYDISLGMLTVRDASPELGMVKR